MSREINNIAIISGSGSLPRLLSEALLTQNKSHALVYFSNQAPCWAAKTSHMISAEFEKIGKLFGELKAGNFNNIVFAGGIQRPKINLSNADDKFLSFAKKILPAMKAGDNKILDLIVEIFVHEGFEVMGSENIIPSLLNSGGVLTINKPKKQDFADIERAQLIVNAIGSVDVGQAAVVSNGVCFGSETIQGTEEMLRFVKNTKQKFHISSSLQNGILYKGPKPGQNLLIDLPTIGPDTILQLKDAGLNGIAIKKNGVYILEREKVISIANKNKLFVAAL